MSVVKFYDKAKVDSLLSNKQDTIPDLDTIRSSAILTLMYSEWTVVPPTYQGSKLTPHWNPNIDEGCWELLNELGESVATPVFQYGKDALELSWDDGEPLVFSATREALPGYVLGSQTDKPIPKLSDIPAVVAPSTDASAAGKAADAKATGDALEALQFKEWFPGGEAKSIADCTPDLKYDWDYADATNHTVEVLPFCNIGDSTKDNSDKSGRVVIPPYIDHDGVRYTVVGVASGVLGGQNGDLTSIAAPTTVTTIEDEAFFGCDALTTVLLPAAMTISDEAFLGCSTLASVFLPVATGIGYETFGNCIALTLASLTDTMVVDVGAFRNCEALTSVSLPAVTGISDEAFSGCTSLASVDFGPNARQSVPELGLGAFPDLSQSDHTCKIIVPDAQYDDWTAKTMMISTPEGEEETNNPWYDLTSMGYEFVKWSSTQPMSKGEIEGEYAKLIDVPSAEAQNEWTHKVWEYANLSVFPATGTENRVYVDKSTNLTYRWDVTSNSYVQIGGSSIDVDDAINATSTNPVQNQVITTALSGKANSAALADPFDSSKAYPANSYVTHDGLMYKCASSVAAGAWDASNWTQVDLMTPDATFDVLADGRLRIADSSGTELWSQGYNLASGSATALSCDKVNYFEFQATGHEAFSESSIYSVDAVVVYNGKVYTCTTAVDTAGPWTGSTNWTETIVSQEFTLPKAGNGKVGDFILDVSNANNSLHEVHVSLAGALGTDYDAIVPRGESLTEILAVPAGGLAEFYFTMTAFGTAAKPAWKVVRQLVEKETAQS